MTLTDLHAALSDLPGDAPLIFRTDDGDIGGGYHVTEFKRARIDSIDCGGNRSAWTEAAIQLLDGSGGTHMTAGKFASILGKSVKAVRGLGDDDYSVEFAPGNVGMRTYRAETPELIGDAVVIVLREGNAICKPLEAHRTAHSTECCARPAAKVSCCGTGAVSSCC